MTSVWLCFALESSQDYLTNDAMAIYGVEVQLQVICDPEDDSTTWRRRHNGPGPVFWRELSVSKSIPRQHHSAAEPEPQSREILHLGARSRAAPCTGAQHGGPAPPEIDGLVSARGAASDVFAGGPGQHQASLNAGGPCSP